MKREMEREMKREMKREREMKRVSEKKTRLKVLEIILDSEFLPSFIQDSEDGGANHSLFRGGGDRDLNSHHE